MNSYKLLSEFQSVTLKNNFCNECGVNHCNINTSKGLQLDLDAQLSRLFTNFELNDKRKLITI